MNTKEILYDYDAGGNIVYKNEYANADALGGKVGSLYPLLLRLEKNKIIKAVTHSSIFTYYKSK